MRVTFPLIPAAYTFTVSVQVSGFEDLRLLTHCDRLLCDSCSSGQCFAFGFLQIPPPDGHPCRSANGSPCRADSGLAPPSHPATTTCTGTAPVKALRAMRGAHARPLRRQPAGHPGIGKNSRKGEDDGNQEIAALATFSNRQDQYTFRSPVTQTQPASKAAVSAIEKLYHPLFLTESALILLVLFLAPLYAFYRKESSEVLRGLNLPKGSVRAMLALLIFGSFVNVLVFGADVMGDKFEQVITAFGTLAGAVTGFYFAGKGADPAPSQNGDTDSQTDSTQNQTT